MKNLLDILSNRRVWAGLVGVAGFVAGLVGVAFNYDADTFVNLLVAVGQALAALVPALLALWSFLRPKSPNNPL